MLERPWRALLRMGIWWGLQRGHAEEAGERTVEEQALPGLTAFALRQ